jgi:hypothetical protein
MDETNVVDLLPLIAECILRRAAEMRVYANRIEREFGGDPDFEDVAGLVRELRACAESIERVGTLEGAPCVGSISQSNSSCEALPCRGSSVRSAGVEGLTCLR